MLPHYTAIVVCSSVRHGRKGLAGAVTAFRCGWLRLVAFAILTLVGCDLAAAEKYMRPNIEAAQRAIQERYVAWSTTVKANGEAEGFPPKIVWPALINGKRPGDYPKDCFYDEELIDAKSGEFNYDFLYFLIADLVNRTVAYLPSDQFADPYLAERLEGRGDDFTLAPAAWPGSQVNPANYTQFFDTVVSEVLKRKHPVIAMGSTDDSGDFDKGGMYRTGGAIRAVCAEATDEALSNWTGYAEHNESGLLLGWADQIYVDGYHEATVVNFRGRYGFDHSAFGTLGGSANIYLFARDYWKSTTGRPATVPLSAGGAPVAEYEKHYLSQSISLASGGKYFTQEYGGGAAAFLSSCPSLSGEDNGQRYGYFLHVMAVTSPNFKENIGSLMAECEGCVSCKDGTCPAGGVTNVIHQSLNYHVSLGASGDDPAGSISLYAETANAWMATPLSLNISATGGTTVLRDATYSEIPRQILLPQGLVDITVTHPFKSYDMRFYDLANRGSKVGDYYQPVPGTEYKKISVSNPALPTSYFTATPPATATYVISAPGHGLVGGGNYYVMRVDADSGELPQGLNIGRLSRKSLYYIYPLNENAVALLFFVNGQAYLDTITDKTPDQVLKISSVFPFNNVVITESTDSVTRSFGYTFTSLTTGGLSELVSSIDGAVVRSSTIETILADATNYAEVAWDEDGAGNVITKTRRDYRVFPWNAGKTHITERRELLAEILDPDGSALATTYSYYDAGTDGPNYSRLKEVIRSQGDWERYEYDYAGRALKTYSSYLDSAPSSDPSTSRLTERSPQSGMPVADLDGDGIDEVLSTTIEKILGNEVARSYSLTWSRIDVQGRQRESNIRCLETGAAWDAASNVRSDLWTMAQGEFDGKPAKGISEAGLLTVYSYIKDEGTQQLTTTVTTGIPAGSGESVVDGTKTITILNPVGAVIDVTTTDIVSGIVLAHEYTPAEYFDSVGRATRVYSLDGRYTRAIYNDCCGTTLRYDKAGILTVETKDTWGKVVSVVRDGIAERYVEGYDTDAADGVTGFTRSTYRKGRASAPEILTGVETYDRAGRIVATLDPRDGVPRLTKFIEATDVNGLWTSRTVAADSSEQKTVFYRDGSIRETLKSNVVQSRQEPGVESSSHDGKMFFARTIKQIQVGDRGEETEWTKDYMDPLGRTYRTEYPDANGQAAGIHALSFFDSQGRLVRQVDPDGVQSLFSQDALGNIRVSALDVNKNGQIDFDGADRVQRTRRQILNVADRGDVVRTIEGAWEQVGVDVETVLAVSDSRTTGSESWSTRHGLTTHSRASYLENGTVESIVERPDLTVVTSATRNEALAYRTTTHPTEGALDSTTFELDQLDRVKLTTNELTGAVTTLTYYDTDLLRTQLTAESAAGVGDAQTTEFIYDNMNRLYSTLLPNGATSEIRYDDRGSIQAQFGANTIPVEYTYDSQGRVRTLTTWEQFDDSTGSGLSGGAITTWNYDARGLLRQKLDQAGLGQRYTYTSGGRIRSRESARFGTDGSSPIVTTYVYGPGGSADTTVETGDLLGIYYTNDPASTPAVENRFDRRGRLESITDGSGKRLLTYDSDSLDSETYVDDGNAATLDPFVGYVSDRNFDAMCRYGGISVQAPGGASIFQVSYQHDDASRLKTVVFNGHTVTYTYDPANETRIAMDYHDGSQSFLSVAQNFDKLNRLKSRISSVGPASKSMSYTYDSLNRRSKATLENGTFWDIGYDARGQVKSTLKKETGGAPIPGFAFAYTFDDIGNRDTATTNGRVSNYEANLLNQYTTLTVPQIVQVQGSANASAVVTVEGQVIPREGADFTAEVELPAGTSPSPAGWRQIEIKGVLAGGGANGADRTSTEKREVFLPKTPIEFHHDGDGNLLEDDRWQYSWDAENRLVVMVNKPELFEPIGINPAIERKRLEFAYDGGGRRVVKKVYSWNAATETWNLTSHLNFLYDGWNLLAEIDAGALLRTYTWGLDLGGSLDGAGGIGGLLFAHSSGSTFSPIYDGNGNVRGLAEASTAAIIAEHEYDHFGNVITVSGSLTSVCQFGFSSKYTDAESGILYYGFRYYNPRVGSWLSRDPVQEQGGPTLYGFVGNDPVNGYDILGLFLPGTGAAASTFVQSPTSAVAAGAFGGGAAGWGLFLVDGFGNMIADANGLPKPHSYPYGQNRVDHLIDAEMLASATQDEIRENARMMEELMIADKVVVNSGEKTDEKTCCKFTWSNFQLGGWPEHDNYARSIFGHGKELIVRAPDGEVARYDGAWSYPSPVVAVGEVKTGRRWSAVGRGRWSSIQQNIFSRDMTQFTRQARVANKCELQYMILMKDKQYGLAGYRTNAPTFSSFLR